MLKHAQKSIPRLQPGFTGLSLVESAGGPLPRSSAFPSRATPSPGGRLGAGDLWGPGSNPGEELHRATLGSISRENPRANCCCYCRKEFLWSGLRSGRSPRLSEPGYLSAISSKSGQSKEIARSSSLRWTRFPMFRRKRAMNCRSESERIFCFAQADGMEGLWTLPEVGAGPFAGTKIEVRRRSLGCANGIAPALRSYVASTQRTLRSM